MNILNIVKRKQQEDKNFVRLLSIVIVIAVLMSIFTHGKFLSMRNMSAMLVLMPELGILSLGIMLAMIVGGIDLSIVAIANLCGILSANVCNKYGMNPYPCNKKSI
jgi:simple sugar transport system permease protein